MAEKYVFLGVEMNVKMNEIEKIQKRCSNPDECLLQVLSVRLKQIPSLTWRDIDTVLRSDTVGEPQIADRIRRQYGHLYSPDPSFEALLDQEQGRKMSEIIKSRKKTKKEKTARKYTQQDLDKEVSESEKIYRKPSEKLQINVNEAVVKKTQKKAKKSHYTKREKVYERETQSKGKTPPKRKATKYDKESKVLCGRQDRLEVKYSEKRAQKVVEIESESESSASSGDQEITQIDNSDSTEESFSSEQEEDSAEEVSETKRHQKPSELPKGVEYPHSHRETAVRKTKGKRGKSSDLEKTKFVSQSKPEGKTKRKKKAEDQSVSISSQHETAGDVRGKREKVARECKQKKSEKHSEKGVQKAPRENESESSAMRSEEERVSSSYHRGKSRKPKSAKDTYQQKQRQGKKLEYQTKAMAMKEVEKKVKESVLVAGEQSSDEEVREKPAPRSFRTKGEQTKSESENESSASTSDDGSEHESTKMKEHHKVYPNTGINETEKEMAVKTKKKTKVTKQKGLHNSDTDMREQSKEGRTSTKVNQKTKKASKEKYHKTNDSSPWKEREKRAKKVRMSSKRKVLERDTSSPGSTQEDSEDEKSYSDDSSEDEEDRDSEQKSSNEEEETEPDDESSPDTSEEVKRKPTVPDTNTRAKDTGETKEKRVKIAANVQDLQRDQSDPGGRDRAQEEHDIQPKKRSRRRHRESSMSPTTRGSSSPSTSQEENRKRRRKGKQEADPGRKKKKRVEKKKEERFSSTETDDSSPESEMLRSLSEAETKNLNKVFKCFFGRLCCAIKDPVETAAQLQAKRLISRSTMKNVITSPESQQVKAITLVRALDNKIKQRPDKIFIITKLFLESELLQEVGRQMLIETGNHNNSFSIELYVYYLLFSFRQNLS